MRSAPRLPFIDNIRWTMIVLVLSMHGCDTYSPFGRGLSDNAFGVYLIHPPILIVFAVVLHGLALHPVAKAAILTVLAAIGSFAASAFVLRKSPLRAIV
jgi:glucan biosynthesis protein C